MPVLDTSTSTMNFHSGSGFCKIGAVVNFSLRLGKGDRADEDHSKCWLLLLTFEVIGAAMVFKLGIWQRNWQILESIAFPLRWLIETSWQQREPSCYSWTPLPNRLRTQRMIQSPCGTHTFRLWHLDGGWWDVVRLPEPAWHAPGMTRSRLRCHLCRQWPSDITCLEYWWTVRKLERHNSILIVPSSSSTECSLPFVTLSDENEIVSTAQIQLGEEPCLSELFQTWRD